MRFLSWIKSHKLTTLLLVIVAMFILNNLGADVTPMSLLSSGGVSERSDYYGGDASLGMGAPGIAQNKMIAPSYRDVAPAPDITDRMVVQTSYLSMQVKNVRETQSAILSQTKAYGGYMVNTDIQSPMESPTATVVVRVPSPRLDEALAYFRGLAVKVVSESLTGEDVTDQYVDIEAQLETLNKTKQKFEVIMAQATEISDILNVQRELISLQSQIDSYKGQQQYLAKSAQTAKLTVYLSADEFSLPYAPSDAWRPEVIFKQAVRSLVGFLRGIATFTIWVVVYGVVVVPALFIARYLFKRFRRKTP